MISLPKEVEERVKAKVQSVTLDELVPPAYGDFHINRFEGMIPITLDMLEDVDDDFDIIEVLEKGIREMRYSDTKITSEDVRKWIDDFANAIGVIDHLEEKTSGDKMYLKGRMRDALFLVAYVESQLGIEVESEVYDRAVQLQHEALLERTEDNK